VKSKPEELRERTRQFAVRVIRLVRALPRTLEGRNIGDQLFRCATPVSANYRAACRARSPKEFVARIGVVVEEADESLYWLELLTDVGIFSKKRLAPLTQEAESLVAIFSASQQTARANLRMANRGTRSITQSPNHSITQSR